MKSFKKLCGLAAALAFLVVSPVPGHAAAKDGVCGKGAKCGDENPCSAKAAPAKGQGSATAEDHYNKGVALGMQGKLKEATAEFKKATVMNPNYALAYNGWGVALAAIGTKDDDGKQNSASRKKYEEAIEKYKKAAALDPRLTKVYYNWGIALNALNRHAEALGMYKKTISIDPAFTPAYNGWGLTLATLGRYEEAIAKFRKVSELEPQSKPQVDSVIKNLEGLIKKGAPRDAKTR